MRADQEVGQNRLTRTTRLSIRRMGVAGEKRSSKRDLLDHRHRRKRRPKNLNALKARRNLRQNDGV